MTGSVSGLGLTSGVLVQPAQTGANSSHSSSPPTPVQRTQEEGFDYRIQIDLLARLQDALKAKAGLQQCYDIFSKLDADVQFRGYQFLCAKSNCRDKQKIVQTGIDRFLKNRVALLGNIEELALFVKSRIPSIEERTQVVSACIRVAHGVAVLISKYAMERFEDEIFGPEQWKTHWGVPVILPPIEKLKAQVNQVITSTGVQPDKEVGKMSAEESANFLKMPGQGEYPEPSEELYECLNRRVRPEDKLLTGFTCVVTYIPQFVRKEGRVLAVTARTLGLELGPHPRQGQAAKLAHPDTAFDKVLDPEDADRTEASCYFVMERDIAPNTRGKKPSILVEERRKQGDKGWHLPEPRNFFAAVFSIRAWKGLFLYGREPLTYTWGQGKSRAGHIVAFGGSSDGGLYVCDSENSANGDEPTGAAGSRKFAPKFEPSNPG